MLSFTTQEMVGCRLQELRAAGARLRVKAPWANHEERIAPPRVVVHRARVASLEELALEPAAALPAAPRA